MPTSYVRALAVAVLTLAAGGVALAAPAAAMEDPRRPTATVTHGPSCGPAVVGPLVTNGTQPYRVALVFDGGAEQDAAVLAAGGQVELVSSGIDWGVTVDVSVAVTAGDGTAEAPLELETYTRPSAEDCAAVAAPPSGSAPPVTRAAPPVATVSDTAPPTTDEPAAPGPSDPVTPAPPSISAPGSTSAAGTSAAGAPPRTGTAGAPAGRSSGSAASSSAAAVSPGGVVTVRATGFTAGEPVTVCIPGVDEPLTTVTAAADGSVETAVQIPRGAALGSTTVQFTGTSSAATAGLDLDVAARDRVVPESTGSPATVAAGLALVGAAGTLALMGARRSRGRHADADR